MHSLKCCSEKVMQAGTIGTHFLSITLHTYLRCSFVNAPKLPKPDTHTRTRARTHTLFFILLHHQPLPICVVWPQVRVWGGKSLRNLWRPPTFSDWGEHVRARTCVSQPERLCEGAQQMGKNAIVQWNWHNKRGVEDKLGNQLRKSWWRKWVSVSLAWNYLNPRHLMSKNGPQW